MMDEGKSAGRLLSMNNASCLSKGIRPVSTVCQPVMEHGLHNTALSVPKGHILQIVGSLYCGFLS